MTAPETEPTPGPESTPDVAADEDTSRRWSLRDELRVDRRAALIVAGATVLGGAVVGVLWALIAPVRPVVQVGGDAAPLDGEGVGGFDATALLVLLVLALGVLAGGLAWRWREHRGPAVLVAVVVGALLGTTVAVAVGTLVASPADALPVLLDRSAASATRAPGPPVPALLAGPAPAVMTWLAVVAGGFGGALGYLVPAIVLGEEDMARPDATSG